MSIRRPRHRPRGLLSLRPAASAPTAPPPGPHLPAEAAPTPVMPAAERRGGHAGHEPQRRVREAGAPEDRATYACRCGAVFPATPTTSVSCPLCGTHQAW